MNKEILNVFDHDFKETSDSCPRCGNPLISKPEERLKVCVTQSFDVKSNAIIPCGYSKII
jgi:ribosomal protein L37E